jgi:hypothetical protein
MPLMMGVFLILDSKPGSFTRHIYRDGLSSELVAESTYPKVQVSQRMCWDWPEAYQASALPFKPRPTCYNGS